MKVANHEATPSQVALRREVLVRIRTMLGDEDAKAVDMMLDNRDHFNIKSEIRYMSCF